jgi:hypothetical protein
MRRYSPHTSTIVILMALALALVHQGGALPAALAGLLLFGALALARPDLGLLFVPLTAPLYLIPVSIQGLRADPNNAFRLPLHEIVLLAALGAFAARWIWRELAAAPADRAKPQEVWHRVYLVRYLPHLLFLLAGMLGVVVAVERSRALREFRWLIVEPLLFYALVLFQNSEQTLARNRASDAQAPSQCSILHAQLIGAFVLSGALVGLLGLLQFAGLDLVPLLGRKECFAPDGGPCANIVADGGVRRVLSVYGHPNNLGLYLGRIWPLAAALALCFAKHKAQSTANKGSTAWFLFFILGALLCLGGILVSFSRGAWLAALAALAVLALGLTGDRASGPGRVRRPSFFAPGPERGRRARPSSWRLLIGLAVAVVVVAGLALSLRGDITAGSTPVRLLLWREAAGYIWQRPLGIGLDQFGYYHDPSSGRSLIDPALIGTSEQYAAHPHNLALDIWLRLGPLGLLAFGWLLVRCFRASPREGSPAGRALTLGATAALVAALAHGLVDNFYFVPDLAIAFWLLLALAQNAGDFSAAPSVPDEATT